MVFYGFPHFQPCAGGCNTSAGDATGSRCPLPFSYGFPMVFHTYSPGPVAVVAPPARHRARVLASIFLWFPCGFPTLSTLGRWLEYLHRLPPRAGAGSSISYGFPVVFLHFQPWAGGWSTSTGCHRARCPLPFSYGFPLVFHTFSPGPVAVVPPPARHRHRVPASIFLWFSYGFPTLSALGRWLYYLHRWPPPAAARG